MRLPRRSLRIHAGAACAMLTLLLGAACGGGAAAPTPTPVAPSSPAAVPAQSPQRPALASPVASPSAVVASAATPTVTTADGPGDNYDVQSGDTLASIAQQFYGDSTQWRRIYDANKDAIGADPDKLKLGMTLKVPPKQS